MIRQFDICWNNSPFFIIEKPQQVMLKTTIYGALWNSLKSIS